MDYTTNFRLAQPEGGGSNSGTAMNGSMTIIDKVLKENRSILCTREGDILFDRVSGDVILDRFNPD